MKGRIDFMPGGGWASPLALRATPSGTGCAQPPPGSPAHEEPCPHPLGLTPSNGSSPPRPP